MLRLNCFFQAKEGRLDDALAAHSASEVFVKCVGVINDCGEMKIEKFVM